MSGLADHTASTTTNAGSPTGGHVSGGTLTTTGPIAGGLTNSATVNANGGAVDGASPTMPHLERWGTVIGNSTFANANGDLRHDNGGT